MTTDTNPANARTAPDATVRVPVTIHEENSGPNIALVKIYRDEEANPANARTLPDDTERQKHIASIVFDMDDELGQTKRLIESAMLSLEAVTMRPIEKLRAKEICSLMDAVSTVLEAALDHHGVLYDQWRTLFDLIREDRANA